MIGFGRLKFIAAFIPFLIGPSPIIDYIANCEEETT